MELHPEKTRLIEFGRDAEVNRKARGEGNPETFAFLGFTHRCGTDREGRFVIWRQSERKRLEAKLQQVKQALRARMHEPVAQVGEWLSRVLRGYYNYHGVPGNRASLNRFRERLMGYWWRVLARRSQRGRLNVNRIKQLAARYIPLPQIMHPYPQVRFDAKHPS